MINNIYRFDEGENITITAELSEYLDEVSKMIDRQNEAIDYINEEIENRKNGFLTSIDIIETELLEILKGE